MKSNINNYFIITILCFLVGCSSVDKFAEIENNQFVYFGRNEKYKFVKIESNKTISEIAQENQVPIKEIKRLNSLKSYDEIKAGTTVKIPIGNYYLIKPNDTLESIARVHDVDINLLAQKNGLSIDSEIYADDYIKIPETKDGFEETGNYKHIDFQSSEIYDDENLEGEQKNEVNENKDEVNDILTTKKSVVVESQKENKFFKNQNPAKSKNFIWPIEGDVIKRYGDHDGKFNEGINISASKGSPVKAASRGEVVYASKQQDHGNLIILRHNNGYMTAYSHLDKFLVKKGQIVNKGTQIGTVGNSGKVDKPQLQFSMKKGNHTINPDG